MTKHLCGRSWSQQAAAIVARMLEISRILLGSPCLKPQTMWASAAENFEYNEATSLSVTVQIWDNPKCPSSSCQTFNSFANENVYKMWIELNWWKIKTNWFKVKHRCVLHRMMRLLHSTQVGTHCTHSFKALIVKGNNIQMSMGMVFNTIEFPSR